MSPKHKDTGDASLLWHVGGGVGSNIMKIESVHCENIMKLVFVAQNFDYSKRVTNDDDDDDHDHDVWWCDVANNDVI